VAKGTRPGRPALPPESIKSYAIGLRVTAELRDLLVKASAASNRSIASEAETRILASFAAEGVGRGLLPAPIGHGVAEHDRPARTDQRERDLPDILEDEFGPHGAALMLAIAIVIDRRPSVYRGPRFRWLSEPQEFSNIADGIRTLLQTIDPALEPAVLENFRRIVVLAYDQLDDPKDGTQLEALAIAEEIGFLDLDMGVGRPSHSPWVKRIRAWLGDAALRHLRGRMPPARESE
jgi:hypothetical protein